jgi:hypothetical protein
MITEINLEDALRALREVRSALEDYEESDGLKPDSHLEAALITLRRVRSALEDYEEFAQ